VEAFIVGTVEGTMCGIAMRDAVAPPGVEGPITSERNASGNLRGLMSGHRLQSRLVRIGR